MTSSDELNHTPAIFLDNRMTGATVSSTMGSLQSPRSPSKRVKPEKPKRAGIVGIDDTIHIKTDVFVKPGILDIPEEFFRGKSKQQKSTSKITISLNRGSKTNKDGMSSAF